MKLLSSVKVSTKPSLIGHKIDRIDSKEEVVEEDNGVITTNYGYRYVWSDGHGRFAQCDRSGRRYGIETPGVLCLANVIPPRG